MKSGILIGIAGGTGSGKSLVSKRIIENLGSDEVALIEQDSYYRDLKHLTPAERARCNFDHPDSIDHDNLYHLLKLLLSGHVIEQPIYDFTKHTLKEEKRVIGPHHIIILEGILVLYFPKLRKLMDIKVFVDTDADIRLLRRIKRDVKERGRSIDSIMKQYEESVRPMHQQFVEPTKSFADIIIPQGGHNNVAIDLFQTKIEALLQKHRAKMREEMGGNKI